MLRGTRTPLVHPAEEPDGHNGRTEQSAFLFIAKNDNWLLTAAGGVAWHRPVGAVAGSR